MASTPKKTPDTAAPDSVVTLQAHVDAQASAIDAKIADLVEKKDGFLSGLEDASGMVRTVKTQQAKAVEEAASALREEKGRILAALEKIPAELRSLEAQIFADLKTLF